MSFLLSNPKRLEFSQSISARGTLKGEEVRGEGEGEEGDNKTLYYY